MVLFLSDPKGFGALANKSLLFSVFSMLVAGAAPKGSLFSNRPVVAAGGAVDKDNVRKEQRNLLIQNYLCSYGHSLA